MKPFGIFLSGCGYQEGTDIWETVLLNYFLEEKKIKTIFLYSVPNSLDRATGNTKTSQISSKSILSEASLMAKGNLKELSDTGSENLDALILPGGEGIIKK